MEEEEGRSFLERLVEEFPAALEEDAPLPVGLSSRQVSLEELHGESLEMGRKLLSARCDRKAVLNCSILLHERRHLRFIRKNEVHEEVNEHQGSTDMVLATGLQ